MKLLILDYDALTCLGILLEYTNQQFGWVYGYNLLCSEISYGKRKSITRTDPYYSLKKINFGHKNIRGQRKLSALVCLFQR